MDEKEKEKIEQDRRFNKEKQEKLKKERSLFIKLTIIFVVAVILIMSIIIYIVSTIDNRAERNFDNDLLAVYDIVLQEKTKKENDPYYEYHGLDPSLRQGSNAQEYEDISQILHMDINEDFYILTGDELKSLGLTDVAGSYLVNYDLSLAFSLDPYVCKDGNVKYTLDKLLLHYTVAKDVDGSGANVPNVLTGMTPIVYNEDFEQWEVVVDLEEETWYNYDKKMWANVMLQDYTDGDIDNLDGSMYVWIPRYAYKISEYNYHTTTAGIIDIKFLIDNTNEAYDGTPIDSTNTDSSKDYVIHPAFTAFGDVSGIWVSKFEASTVEYGETGAGKNNTNDPKLTYKSYFDRYSWTNMEVKNQYEVGKKMAENSVYGLDPKQANTHMMKNTEWGAVAYLTQSAYGRNNNAVWSNNYYDEYGVKTGYSARSSSDRKYGSEIDYETFAWNTTNGVRASTTGNVYGVYDMVGGAIERMAAFLDNYSDTLKEFGPNMLGEYDRRYVDVYYTGKEDTQTANYNMTIYKFGDALYETSLQGYNNAKSSWYSTSSVMINNNYPFMFRGGAGVIREESLAGLFYFSPSSGGLNPLSSFRTVIIEQ